MTPPPIALSLIVCEKAIVEERTRNLTLVSTFTKMLVDRFPSLPQQLVVYSVLTDGVGDATIDLVVTRLDTGEDVYLLRAQSHFPDRLTEVPVLYRVNGCSFPAPGKYQLTLLVDGEWVAQRQMTIMERKV